MAPGWFLPRTSPRTRINHKTSSIPRNTLELKNAIWQLDYTSYSCFHAVGGITWLTLTLITWPAVRVTRRVDFSFAFVSLHFVAGNSGWSCTFYYFCHLWPLRGDCKAKGNILQQCRRMSCWLWVCVRHPDRCPVYHRHRLPGYTRRQINQDRMIFGDVSVNSELIFLKFCKGHFLFKS